MLAGIGTANLFAGSSPDHVWFSASPLAKAAEQKQPVSADRDLLEATLADAPDEFSGLGGVSLYLPLRDGKFKEFAVFRSGIMAPGLAAQFPEIKTYVGFATDGLGAVARLDTSPLGINAMIVAPDGEIYIDQAAQGGPENCLIYRRSDVDLPDAHWHCLTAPSEPEVRPPFDKQAPIEGNTKAPPSSGARKRATGTELRIFRLAVATTGEYTQYHGGSVTSGQAAVVTAINRVSGVFESELAIRLQLVANNSTLIFTSPNTDPYTNSDPEALLSQNQTQIDSRIGSANYDIGHVFSTGGGGLAALGSVGDDQTKAQGETGKSDPIGDAFWIDLVAHEIGHQFGAEHTFNGDSSACNDNRSPISAYEPGSGVTIMGYAGICGNDDLQEFGLPFYHFQSFNQITNHISNNIPSVGIRMATGNSIPVVDAGANYVIPARTPFELTATGSDADNDPLTYSWEQADLGAQRDLSDNDNGFSPLFRFFTPSSSPTRVFPRLTDLLANTTVKGEKLPTTNRNLTFRVTVRDGRSVGGVNSDTSLVKVVDTGAAFAISSPNTTVFWTKGSIRTVTWNIAGTTSNGIDASQVDILLSSDGGNTYPVTLASRVANSGSAQVVIPVIATTSSARVKVKASDNVFFDVSDSNFIISGEPGASLAVTPPARTVAQGEKAIYQIAAVSSDSTGRQILLSVSGLPSGVSASFSENPIQTGGFSILTLTTTGAPTTSEAAITISGSVMGATGAQNISQLITLGIDSAMPTVTSLTAPASSATAQPIRPQFQWAAASRARYYDLEISSTGTGFVRPLRISTTSTTSSDITLLPSRTYHWRVRSVNSTGSTLSSVRSFTTSALPGNKSQTVNTNIPDASATGLSQSIVVAQGGILSDLDLAVEIDHTWVGDLTVTLTHQETGTSITAISALGGGRCSGDNFNVIFDDASSLAAATNCSNGTPALAAGQRYRPLDPLSVFNAENFAGTWTIKVLDLQAGDTGSLRNWSLIPTFADTRTPFEEWRIANFNASQLADTAKSGQTADPDSDGRSNFAEYFFGSAPLLPDPAVNAPQFGSLAAGLPLSFRYTRSGLRYDAVETPQNSTNLVDWSPLPRRRLGPQSMDQTIEAMSGTSSPPRSFFRLMIERSD